MWGTKAYQDYEVGSGWVDPSRLGQRLTSGLRWIRSTGGSGLERWLGAAALTLVILSWWQDAPVRQIAAWIVGLLMKVVN